MATRKFIIFFQEKEGTSALVRLLNNFDQISVLHQTENQGWEPFDIHNCGPMSLRSLRKCMDLIYSKDTLDMVLLNQIYTKTARRPLETFDKDGAVGFKMRFVPPKITSALFSKLPAVRKSIMPKYKGLQVGYFKKLMFDLLKEHNVVAFVAVRQDMLRWALSKYHGDGRGQNGHLQFKLADGLITKKDIPRINVDCDRLGKVILGCERRLQEKRSLMEEFGQSGIRMYPLLYEKFCNDKLHYLEQIFNQLKIVVSKEKIEAEIRKGTHFQKVHSEDISEFVVNHQEVVDRFEKRYHVWH